MKLLHITALLVIALNESDGFQFSPMTSKRALASTFQRHFLTPVSDKRAVSNNIRLQSTTAEEQEVVELEQDDAGVFQLTNEAEHRALLAKYPDSLLVIKFYAPWCRACKGLAPRYKAEALKPQHKNILFAELSVQHNKDYVKSLGILALPSILMYGRGGKLVENFPCGPSKISILRQKLSDYVQKIDKSSGKLIDSVDQEAELLSSTGETAPVEQKKNVMSIKEIGSNSTYGLSEADLEMLRAVPFFKDYEEAEFNDLMQKAELQTFEVGSILMRQGMPGTKFFVIQSGEVEISVKAAFEDPLTTPSNYLGAVVNILAKGNYFGERSLITGEPRAASIRTCARTKCFVFNQEDIPASSVLSGKKIASQERLSIMNDKYGTDVNNVDLLKKNFDSYKFASQSRGSVNSPAPIPDVDTSAADNEQQNNILDPMDDKRDDIFRLLRRFKLIRMATRLYKHISSTKPNFGDKYAAYRRSMLLKKVSPSQISEYTEVFRLIDVNNDGAVSEEELKRVVDSIAPSEKDQIEVELPTSTKSITYEEFMSVLAESEFNYLFNETFDALDTNNSGFVKAADIRNILGGVRDLISDDQMMIIDVGPEDDDLLINYEQFTRMMLGVKP